MSLSKTISKKKINDCVVPEAPKFGGNDTRSFRGEELFSDGYSNIFFSAKKKSGKTTNLFFVLMKIMSAKTKLILFVSTAHKDPIWINLINLLKKKKIEVDVHTSLKGDKGEDLLTEYVDEWQNDISIAQGEEKTDEDELDYKIGKGPMPSQAQAQEILRQKSLLTVDSILKFNNPELVKEKGKPKKSKYRERKYVIVMDDLSTELKSKSLVGFLKKSRHFLATVLLSSQYYLDILPESRKQIDYFLLYKGLNEEKLEAVFNDADLSIGYTEFKDLYEDATKEKYSFLYIDVRNSKFRENYNKEYIINET